MIEKIFTQRLAGFGIDMWSKASLASSEIIESKVMVNSVIPYTYFLSNKIFFSIKFSYYPNPWIFGAVTERNFREKIQ